MKHSPIPWQHGRPGQYGTYSAGTLFDAEGAGIAQFFHIPLHITVEEAIRDKENERGLANLNLAKAAPKLLALLKTIVEYEGEVCSFPTKTHQFDEARALIKELEGE